MFYVYVLKSKKDDKLYVGLTSDLKRRVKEHESGASKATKFRRPVVLIYYEAYYSYGDARRREIRLKQFKNGYKELKKRIIDSLNKV